MAMNQNELQRQADSSSLMPAGWEHTDDFLVINTSG